MRVVLATILGSLCLTAPTLADAIGPCPDGQIVVVNPTPAGAMHHGGFHCEPDPNASRCSALPGARAESTSSLVIVGIAGLAIDGHEITALVRDATGASAWLRERGRVASCDLATPIESAPLEGHDACVHLAVLWPDASAQPELDDVSASVRLFDALGRARVGHVVYVSSAAVHRPFRANMREDDRLIGADAYGAAKIAGEAFLRASAATYGFRASVVRAGPCVGPSADPDRAPKTPNQVLALHRALANGERLSVHAHDGRQLTSCLDLSQTIDRLLGDPSAPDTLLCMARRTTTWSEVAHSLARKLERENLVHVVDGARDESWFDASVIERFLGRTLAADAALDAHLDCLVAPTSRGSSSLDAR